MAHNFKLTGNIYVSKDGSDGNAGTSPDAPKLTVAAGLNALGANGRLIIGTGVYRESIGRTTNGTTHNIYADGEVVLLDFTLTFTLQLNTNSFLVINGITFSNYTLNSGSNGSGSNGTQGVTFNNCKFYSCIHDYTSSSNFTNSPFVTFSNCIFVNSMITNATTLQEQYIRCILINTVTNATSRTYIIRGTYIDSTSVVRGYSSMAATDFNFNNLQGNIVINVASTVTSGVIQDTSGNYYDLSIAGSGGTGTIGDPFWRNNTNGAAFYFTEHKIAYPTFNTRSFSANPLFNDVANLDFTLQSTSPHIRAANDYKSNIGGTEYAVHKAAGSSEFLGLATVNNLTFAGGVYTITNPATEGYVTSAPIFLQWPLTRPLTNIPYTGNLEYDKSVAGGLAGNNNVPAYNTYTTGAGGSNPDRLTIMMRYSTQQAEPTLAAHWDNGGYWTAGDYREFEINTKPKIDVNGRGNGDPLYIESSALGDLVPSWVQVEVKLRNDYNA